MSKPEEKVSMVMITKFYYSLDQVNMSYIKGKVEGNTFHLDVNIIVDYRRMPKEGDTTYYDNVPMPSFVQFYLPEDRIVGTVLKEGVKFKNPMKTKDLKRLALIFWQIMLS